MCKFYHCTAQEEEYLKLSGSVPQQQQQQQVQQHAMSNLAMATMAGMGMGGNMGQLAGMAGMANMMGMAGMAGMAGVGAMGAMGSTLSLGMLPQQASAGAALAPGELLNVCKDYQRGRCLRPACKFHHVTADQEQQYYQQQGLSSASANAAAAAAAASAAAAAQNNLYGTLQQASGATLEVCKDFQQGKCTRPICKYYHFTPAQEESYRISVGAVPLPVYMFNTMCAPAIPQRKDPRDDITICFDFLRGACSRDDCKYFHGRKEDILIFCRDFQQGKCVRPGCKFVHGSAEDEQRYRVTLTPDLKRRHDELGELAAGMDSSTAAGPAPGVAEEPASKRSRLSD